MSERTTFPVHSQCPIRRRFPDLCPKTVPLCAFDGHERQVIANHCGQTIARLAERGGMAVMELWLGLHDKRLNAPVPHEYEMLAFVRQLNGLEPYVTGR